MQISSRFLDASCSLYAADHGAFRSGCGVFIAPDTIVTAGHVLEDFSLESFIIVNNWQSGARLKEDVAPVTSTDLDLAVVKLDLPIGRTFCPVASVAKAEQVRKGWLLSRFGVHADLSPLRVNPYASIVQRPPHSQFSYRTNQQVRKGFSGSGVLTEDGCWAGCLCSISPHRQQAATVSEDKAIMQEEYHIADHAYHIDRVLGPARVPLDEDGRLILCLDREALPQRFYCASPVDAVHFVRQACSDLDL